MIRRGASPWEGGDEGRASRESGGRGLAYFAFRRTLADSPFDHHREASRSIASRSSVRRPALIAVRRRADSRFLTPLSSFIATSIGIPILIRSRRHFREDDSGYAGSGLRYHFEFRDGHLDRATVRTPPPEERLHASNRAGAVILHAT